MENEHPALDPRGVPPAAPSAYSSSSRLAPIGRSSRHTEHVPSLHLLFHYDTSWSVQLHTSICSSLVSTTCIPVLVETEARAPGLLHIWLLGNGVLRCEAVA
mgnify:CR=1 FL=1